MVEWDLTLEAASFSDLTSFTQGRCVDLIIFGRLSLPADNFWEEKLGYFISLLTVETSENFQASAEVCKFPVGQSDELYSKIKNPNIEGYVC